ncbi:GNAT family N-acetyltransferase [Paenibacillus sp. sptzw28]|uniref:GNAT family N-acetyltransferase n=1 Tax=Paenibacillus sp. sptzw28 TaxID=715179 RepID=UPI001C6DDA68|nr:GNAT family N-acetyltransferase [Paenibacillus sp. sptzw28]QYR23468.1 GNAT family N-acetyltransferase [Paenibacillus sp. sptzw28]
MSRHIKLAQKNEIGLVYQLIQEAFQEYDGKLDPPSGALRESEESISKKISELGGAIIVWEDTMPIGTALYDFTGEYMYIGRVSVVPDSRGQGIGKELILYLEALARERQLKTTRVGVRLSIPQNVIFYQRLGYQVLNHIFYPEGTDSWYVMQKNL